MNTRGDIKQGRVAGTCSWDKITATSHTAVQRVHATESAFQPITNNDQNSSCSALGKINMVAMDSGVRFDWGR